MHVLDGVLAVDDVLALILNRATQCGVKHSAVLGVVDVHAGVLLLDALIKLDVLGEVCEKLEGFRLDEVLRQIEVEVACLEAQLLGALGVLSEPLAQVDAFCLQLVVMLLQGSPRRGLRCINRRIDGHDAGPFLCIYRHVIDGYSSDLAAYEVPLNNLLTQRTGGKGKTACRHLPSPSQ